ncbi:MAG TPA: DUF3320 domain-containing protein, partial [Vicinamibacteria bacterium]
RRAALRAWWRAEREDSPALRDFDAAELEGDLAAFREADRRCRERARREVLAAAEARRPAPDALEGVGGEAAAMGLRALALQLREVLRTAAPVVMACPLTAGLLPREMLFDRVAVHEGAGLAVEEALAALARGRQAVVFGTGAAAGSSGGLLAEVAAAGAPVVHLTGDYRAPGAPYAATAPAAPDPLRQQVTRAVEALGYGVQERAGPDAGAALLWASPAGGAPGPLVAIDANDAAPAGARRTLGERYALLPAFVESAGAVLHRVHALQWVDDPEAALEVLRAALPAPLAAAPAARPAPRQPVPYEVASLAGFGLSATVLRDPRRRQVVVDALRHVVEVEGPVHRDRVAARILAACGLRPGRRRQPDFEKALRAAVDEGAVEERRGFLHAPGGSPPRVRTPRGDAASRRRLAELPPEELVLAAEMLLAPQGRLRRPALFTEMSRLFGLWRGTRRAELEKALRAAGAARLTLEDEWVSLRRD